MTNGKHILAIIFAIMNERKIKGTQMAAMIGVSATSFSAWVCGNKFPIDKNIEAMVKALGFHSVQALGFAPDWYTKIVTESPEYEVELEKLVHGHYTKWFKGKQISTGVIPAGAGGEFGMSKSILQVKTIVNHGAGGTL